MEEDGAVVAVAGFHVRENLAWGHHLYVDDLVTDATRRSTGAGRALAAWLSAHARAAACGRIELDSKGERLAAHRFCLRERFEVRSHPFSLELRPRRGAGSRPEAGCAYDAAPGGAMKRVGWPLFIVLLVAAIAAVWIYQQLATLQTEAVTPDVWMLSGLGGNVGVLRSGRGAVVVDTMSFRMQGERIRERVEDLTGREVEVILNTHYHWDHTHGNPAFPAGLRIVATQRTLELMQALDGRYFSGAALESLPNETFTDTHELRIGEKTVRSYHLGRGHTDGDQVVLFVEDRVLHFGDLYFHRRYPNIDLEAGGSVREWPATLARALALDGWDHALPGHGAVSDRAGVEQFQRFLRELWEQVEPLARAGRTLEETRAAVRLTEDAGYEAIAIPGIVRLDRDFVVRRAWEEATGTVERRVEQGEQRVLALGH